MSEIVNLPAFILGILGLFTLLTGAYVALRKLQPESTKIEIETADKLVQIAERAASMADRSADDLRERNRILDDRLTELAGEVGGLREQLLDIPALRREVASLAAQLTAVTDDRNRLHRENDALRVRVDDLEAEVARLRAAGANGH